NLIRREGDTKCRHLSSSMLRMNFPLMACGRFRIMRKPWSASAPGVRLLVKKAHRSRGFVTTTNRMSRELLCREHGAQSFPADSGRAQVSVRKSYLKRMSTEHSLERASRIGYVGSEPTACC